MTKTHKAKREVPTRPRGTRDLLGNVFYNFQGFFEKAADIAHYYGFSPIETPILEKEEVFTSGVGTHTDIVQKKMYTLRVRGGEKLALRPEGTASIMRAYLEGGMHTMPQPVLLYYYGPFFRHDKPQRGRFREFFQFGLEALGSSKSIVDAMIIQVTTTILKEAGLKNVCVLINTIGDRDCRPEYIRELALYYRKHLSSICPHCRQRIKVNPLRLLDCKDERCLPFKEEAPQMLGFVCTACKEHFKEVLEYLEAMRVHYEIDHSLVRGIDYYARTVFEIIDDEERCQTKEKEKGEKKKETGEDKAETQEEKKEEKALPSLVVASGGRYDGLGKQLGGKKDVPAIGVAIGVDRVLEIGETHLLSPRILKKPKIYFIQIGFEAKLKSLQVIEILRKARIPIMHTLNKDKLSVQLALAEKSKVPLTLIIGQKEALENTVIVRDMTTRSQETVKIEKLADYVKKKI